MDSRFFSSFIWCHQSPLFFTFSCLNYQSKWDENVDQSGGLLLHFFPTTLMSTISRRHRQMSFEAAQSKSPDVGVTNLQILAFWKSSIYFPLLCIDVFHLSLKHLKLLFSSILKNLLGFFDTGDKCFQFPPFSARFIVAIFRINCGIHQLANLDKSERDKDFAKIIYTFTILFVCGLLWPC